MCGSCAQIWGRIWISDAISAVNTLTAVKHTSHTHTHTPKHTRVHTHTRTLKHTQPLDSQLACCICFFCAAFFALRKRKLLGLIDSSNFRVTSGAFRVFDVPLTPHPSALPLHCVCALGAFSFVLRTIAQSSLCLSRPPIRPHFLIFLFYAVLHNLNFMNSNWDSNTDSFGEGNMPSLSIITLLKFQQFSYGMTFCLCFQTLSGSTFL